MPLPPLLFRLHVALVVLAGAVVLGGAVADLDRASVVGMEPAFWGVCLLLLAVQVRPLLAVSGRHQDGHVLTTAFVFAMLLRYGLPIAVVVQVLATAGTDVSRGKAPWRIAFNVSQYALSWAAASAVMDLLGLRSGAAVPRELSGHDLAVAVAGGLTCFVVSQVLVTVAVSLETGRPLQRLVRERLAHEAVTDGALLALAPLIVLALEEGVLFLPLLLPPLFALQRVAAIALEREQQALTDGLTGLPNRKLLATRTDEALAAHDGPVALLLFDLDRFKEVNDTLGHHIGDQLLEVVGTRLTAAVRPGDTVARLGGDEFAVLLPDTPGERADRAAHRLLAELAVPVRLEGLLVDIGASVGIAVAPEHGTALDELLQHADVAMYLAKETGAGVEQYDADRDRNSTQRLVMLGELRRAIVGGDLEVHYQPKASLVTGVVDSVEALVRWRHPERGLIPPDDFIPLAESSGLIEQVTANVLDQTVAQLAAWRSAGLLLTAAVNVSVRDLAGDRLVGAVSRALDRHGMPAEQLQLEVTEGSLFAESHRAAATMRQLEVLGVTLSLDDFGTGYSSLGHLRRLPVREIKIDRSFVQRMERDACDRAIVRSVVDLGSGLGMRVVAEGVEDERTWDVLREMGCDSAQGWYLSRAEPAHVLTPWLLARREVLARR